MDFTDFPLAKNKKNLCNLLPKNPCNPWTVFSIAYLPIPYCLFPYLPNQQERFAGDVSIETAPQRLQRNEPRGHLGPPAQPCEILALPPMTF